MKQAETKPVISRTYDRRWEGGGWRPYSERAAMWHSALRSVLGDWEAFATSFHSFAPSSPSSLLLAQHISRSAHFPALWRNECFSWQRPDCLPAAQVPTPCSVCLLHSLHYAGINFSKPIWAAARLDGKSIEQNFCAGGSFPFTPA